MSEIKSTNITWHEHSVSAEAPRETEWTQGGRCLVYRVKCMRKKYGSQHCRSSPSSEECSHLCIGW